MTFLIYNRFLSYVGVRTLHAKEVDKVNLADINPVNPENAKSIYDFSVLDIDGNLVKMSKYKGFVSYIVNVASQ